MYNAFGASVSETDAAVDHLLSYTGRQWDDATGLQFNRARYYDPSLGRFISQDPLSFAAGDANLYRYVGNHATVGTDPSGRTSIGSPNTDSASGLRFNDAYEGWGWWGAEHLGRVIYDPNVTSDEAAYDLASELGRDNTNFGAYFALDQKVTSHSAYEKFQRTLFGKFLGLLGAFGEGDT